jgi:AcrR family transcriptional regulator
MTDSVEGGRRQRADGRRTRARILQVAARLATVEGLEGLSLGRLAEATGMSKSGLYAHFGSKEELQLAAIGTARRIFTDEVVARGQREGRGTGEARGLCDAFLSYVERDVFPGGCFFSAAAAEMGSRPGRVHDAIAKAQRQWMAVLRRALTADRRRGELPPELDGVDLGDLAFELNALLVAANTAVQLHGDREAVDRARRVVRRRLGGAADGGAPG